MRPEFKYGLITGVGVSLWILAEYLLGFHTTRMAIGECSRYFSCVVPAITLFILLRKKQAASPKYPLTIRQSIAAGLFVSLVAAMIVSTFLVAYHRWINPFGIENILAGKVVQMRATGIDEIAIRREITSYRQVNGPVGLVITTFGGMALTCAILSALLTPIVRSKPRVSNP